MSYSANMAVPILRAVTASPLHSQLSWLLSSANMVVPKSRDSRDFQVTTPPPPPPPPHLSYSAKMAVPSLRAVMTSPLSRLPSPAPSGCMAAMTSGHFFINCPGYHPPPSLGGVANTDRFHTLADQPQALQGRQNKKQSHTKRAMPVIAEEPK